MENSINRKTQIKNGASLPKSQKAFYGVGHILNDLCANCWFSYALIYWTKIVGLSETDAGLLLLIGQIADAICTIFIGQACDRTTFRWYGKRKVWHIIGTISVLVSFPFVFNLCINCKNASETVKIIYYAAFVIIFQFGWAATQISHFALIPEIASRQSDIVHLNSIRSGLLFICGIFVYGVTWFLLGSADSGREVDASLAPQFKYLSIVVVAVGLVFTVIFHVGTKEEITYNKGKQKLKNEKNSESDPENDVTANNNSKDDVNNEGKNKNSVTFDDEEMRKNDVIDIQVTQISKSWKEWLKDPKLYKTGVLYMSTRLTINIYQSFINLYLTDALHLNKEAIAYFPLILLVSGALTSFAMQKITKKIGSQKTYIIGASFIIIGSIWLFSINRASYHSVYGATIFSGCGISIMLVTALAKIAQVIGKDKGSGAFVYSCMSFMDKLATGIVIFIIQALKPSSTERHLCSECAWFSKIVQSVIPGVWACLGLLFMLLLFPSEFSCHSCLPTTFSRPEKAGMTKSSVSKTDLIDRNTDDGHIDDVTGIKMTTTNNKIDNGNNNNKENKTNVKPTPSTNQITTETSNSNHSNRSSRCSSTSSHNSSTTKNESHVNDGFVDD